VNASPLPAFAPTVRLAVELVPRSAWHSNLRKFLTREEWQRLTKIALEAAGHRCEACGSQGQFIGKNRATGAMKFRLDTHETWDFNVPARTQTLLRNRALCPQCHESTHMGLAEVNGRAEAARKHLALVNHWTPAQAAAHEAEAWRRWHERNQVEAWVIDIRVLHAIDPSSYEAATAFLQAQLRSRAA
jgi:hypothetical protein